MGIAFGENYNLDIYFGSLNIQDYYEHLYYNLTFMNKDNIPIISIPIPECGYSALIDSMEYLTEYCSFSFDFPPSKPLTQYTLWAEYVTDEEGYEVTNTQGLSAVSVARLPSPNEAYVHIIIVETHYPSINENVLIDTKMSAEDYFNLWRYMTDNWVEDYAC